MEKMANTLEAFEAEAKDFLQTITPTAAGATLITFSGELGAGKTAFTKVIARELGVQEVVTSPTFVLEKIYRLSTGQRFARLIHIDAYRLDTGSELAALGFDEAMKDPENLILLEWPERVADALPPPAKRITIEVMASGARKVMYG